jgi:hypothetical protein
MITDKEYPATHSMSTAWFAVDLDGNVALLNFEENGPVPCNLPESSMEEMIFDMMLANQGDKKLNYTDEQIERIMANSTPVTDNIDLKYKDYIVQIDVSKTELFDNIINSLEVCAYLCFSKEKGVYYICFLDIPEKSAKELFEQHVFLRYIHFDDLLDSDCLEKQDFEHPLQDFPFYIYQQYYSSSKALQKIISPEYPVKIEQFPANKRELALPIPVRFSDSNLLQIAEYFPFDTHGEDTKNINNIEYDLFQRSDGSEIYICGQTLPPVYCGENCQKCPESKKKNNVQTYIKQFALYPTVLVIYNIEKNTYDLEVNHRNIFQHSVIVPCLYGIYFNEDYGNDKDFLRKQSLEEIERIFTNCKKHLEEEVSFLHPNVVLLTPSSKRVLVDFYPVNDKEITISGETIPYFMVRDIDSHEDEILALSKQPYRGKKVKRMITKDEMWELLLKDKLKIKMNDSGKFMSAIFFSDIETIRSMTDADSTLYSQNICRKNATFPIFSITKCVEKVFNSNDFEDDMKPIVEEMRKRTKDVMDFWNNECHLHFDDEIDYYEINEIMHFNRISKDINTIKEEITSNKRKYTDFDVQFIRAASQLDFKTTKKLLKKGADPNKLIFPLFTSVKDFSMIDMVFNEIDFFTTKVIELYKEYFSGKKLFAVDYTDIGNLYGRAAFKSMCSLLKTYSNDGKQH